MNTRSGRRLFNPGWQTHISILTLSIFLASCLPVGDTAPPPPWRYSELRILAPPPAGADSLQLVGLYTRTYRSDLQIRLDLLEYEPQDEFDLFLAIDIQPGGTDQLPFQVRADIAWDLLLTIPTSGPFSAVGPDGEVLQELRLRVARNPVLDTLTVSLDQSAVGSRFNIQAFITESEDSVPASSLGPARSDASATPRLPVTLAFWNTYTAYTPSQALRRLDGAHSGPSSDRHGLRGLLDAVESAQFPAVLLDLKTPASLSALDYTGSLARVRSLASQNLLILPDSYPLKLDSGITSNLPGWLLTASANKNIQVWEAFGLRSSPFLYTTDIPGSWLADLPREIGQYRLIFSNPAPPISLLKNEPGETVLEGENQTAGHDSLSPTVSRWQASRVVDLSSIRSDLLESDQATRSGPSLEVKRALLEAASNPTRGLFALLGGDLAGTAWGNPTAARQTLHYLKSRPWLQPMSASDLDSILPAHSAEAMSDLNRWLPNGTAAAMTPFSPDGSPARFGLTIEQIQVQLMEDLQRASENAASELAWQAYEALLGLPILPHPGLTPLRLGYLGQVGHLLAASRWEDSGATAFCGSTGSQGSCVTAQDLDWDSEDEYLLISQDLFLLFEARGGYLAAAFWRSPEGVYQFIAPSSHFIVGMGDPMSWDPGKGVAGDPAQYRGAFSDLPSGFSTPTWYAYHADPSSESLTFTALDGILSKSFSITPSSVRATYNTAQPLTVQIPLAVDPSFRFTAGWGDKYFSQSLERGWLWGLKDRLHVQILSSEKISFSAFSDSYKYMGQPEDPDFEFPSGHFLPFPMALGEVSAAGEFSIEILLSVP